MTLMTRSDWTDAFTHDLLRFLIAGKPAVAVHATHAGVVCGSYDVTIAMPDPHHEARIRIIVTYNRTEPPICVTLPGTEFDAYLADEPRSVALKVTRWLLPQLAADAA